MTIVADHLKVKIFQVRTPTKNWSSGKRKENKKTNKQINKIKKTLQKSHDRHTGGGQAIPIVNFTWSTCMNVHLSNGPLLFSA